MSIGLPALGTEIPMSTLAVGSTIEYQGKTLTADFRGGTKQRVDADPDDPDNSVRLRVTLFRMADGPQESPTVVIEQNDVDVAPESRLKLVQQFPPRYEHRQVFSFSLALLSGDGKEPVVLVTKKPMVLIGDLTHFPPRGDVYRLENPVDLVDPEAPATVVARITAFPAKQGGM